MDYHFFKIEFLASESDDTTFEGLKTLIDQFFYDIKISL